MKVEDLNKLLRTDEEVDEKLMDAIIIAGCHELIKSESFVPTEEELKKIDSKELDEKMKEFFLKLSDEEKFRKRRKRIAGFKNIMLKISACFAVLFIISIVIVASSEAAQVVFMNTYVEVFDIKTDFHITSENEQIPFDTEYEQFEYIPFGFEMVEVFDDDYLYMATLENIDGKYIVIQITQEAHITIDTEDAKVTEKYIGDKNCFISEKDGITIIFFMYEERAYVIESDINMEEIEKIIKNIK
jgi:hypothetical protein